MNEKTILVLGGYGNTGRPLSRLLVQETPARLVLAGRSQARAEQAAGELNRMCGERRASGLAVDAGDPAGLRRALAGVDLVLAASSTARWAGQVAEAALEAGCDYLDIQYSTRKVELLKALAPRIEAAGACFITDGGFHPGLPAALVRAMALRFETLEAANVGSVIREDWKKLDVPLDTVAELVEEFLDFQTFLFQDGEWRQPSLAGMGGYRRMDFGPRFGRQYCVPMGLEEMRLLPGQIPGLRETGFFVGGFNPVVDWLLMPVIWAGMKLSPGRALRPLARLMKWGLETFSRPPFGTLLKVEAQGRQAGQPKTASLTVYHEDGYLLTAIPVAACLLQYLDGARRPGLWTQANFVDPARLLADMQRMGVAITPA